MRHSRLCGLGFGFRKAGSKHVKYLPVVGHAFYLQINRISGNYKLESSLPSGRKNTCGNPGKYYRLLREKICDNSSFLEKRIARRVCQPIRFRSEGRYIILRDYPIYNQGHHLSILLCAHQTSF
jgi:hypothetical protein